MTARAIVIEAGQGISQGISLGSLLRRVKILRLLREYGAHIEITYTEVDPEQL